MRIQASDKVGLGADPIGLAQVVACAVRMDRWPAYSHPCRLPASDFLSRSGEAFRGLVPRCRDVRLTAVCRGR